MFYIIDKQANSTSRDTVDELLKKIGIKKGGHSGTLDPFATGLLIIATEKDTKYLDRFLESKKTYTGTLFFGKTTDTLDVDGEVTEEKLDANVDLITLQKVINEHFIGKIKQVPPRFSAKKINGKKAYELSRSNQDFELKPVKKIVFDFKVKATATPNEFSFEVTASSGTYIRALARDIGRKLEVPGMLTSLRRTKIGSVDIKLAQPLSLPPEELKTHSITELSKIKMITIRDDLIKLILEGKRTNFDGYDGFQDDELIFVNIDKTIEVLVRKADRDKTYKIAKRIR